MQRNSAGGTSAATLRSLSDFLKTSTAARERALIFNFDGSLGRFYPSRNRPEPHPELLHVLQRLQADTESRLVIVTGRPASSIAQSLGLANIDVWGCNGLERLNGDGAIDQAEIPAEALQAIADAGELFNRDGLGEFAEIKFASIAIHWRGRETHAGHLTRRVLHAWSIVKSRKGVLLVPFDGGIEIMAGARNRGHVVQTVLSELGPDSAVVYLGGETTDEDGFAALRGRGLNILVREQYRRTIADVWLRPPDEVGDFLQAWIAACEPSRRGLGATAGL